MEMAFKTFTSVLVLSLALSGVAIGQKPVAQLPQATVDTTWSLPSGQTWAAHDAAGFKNALSSANPGDVIVLDAGTVYKGNFKVPAKSNPSGQWIYIVSSNLSSLPATGTRVSPSDAMNMPKIVTPNVSQALSFYSGSNHIRLVGVEIYSASTYSPTGYTPGVYYGYAMVSVAGNWPWPTPIPDNIIFDRCYVHGDANHDVQEALQLNFSNAAVVDSYISDIHMKGTDTQAIAAYYTPGPILIHNNHLEAAGENVMFGGAGRNADQWVPSDITVTDNYIYKPLSWVPLSTGTSPTMVVKNSFELKSAQRVLFDNNVIENKWSAGQVGGAFVMTVRTSQSGDIAVVHDITITNNIFKNVVRGFDVMEADYNCGTIAYPNCHNAGDTDRIVIKNNLLTLYDPTQVGGIGQHSGLIMFTTGRDLINNVDPPVKDVLVQHNTVVSNPNGRCFSSVYFTVPGGWKIPFPGPLSNNTWILDNVLCKQPTGDWGLQGTSGLTQYMGSPSTPSYDLTQRFYGNVMYVPVGDKVQPFPPHNYATTVPVVYANQSIADYQLVSPYWTNTSDGQLAGVNFSQLPASTGSNTPAQPSLSMTTTVGAGASVRK
jgi:hypothetical protein